MLDPTLVTQFLSIMLYRKKVIIIPPDTVSDCTFREMKILYFLQFLQGISSAFGGFFGISLCRNMCTVVLNKENVDEWDCVTSYITTSLGIIHKPRGLFGKVVFIPSYDHKWKYFFRYFVVSRICIKYWRYRKANPDIILLSFTK